MQINETFFLPIIISGALLFLIFLFFIVAYILTYRRKQQHNRLEKARLIFDHQEHLLRTRLEEQERAMNQISREIHDNVSQKIDFLHMNIKALADAEIDPKYRRFVTNSNNLAQQIANDLRNVSYTLNTDYIKARGLGEVLEKELNYIHESQNTNCDLQIEGSYRSFPGDTELIIFRIAQEALHNISKHAKANNILIRLQYDVRSLLMTIKDDGRGFDSTASTFVAGLGVKNMQQRALLLDSSLRVDSLPGNGCTITLRYEEKDQA